MEENLIPIYTLSVIKGHTSVNIDSLSQVILQNASRRLSSNPSHTHYEDSYCPDSAIIDRVIEDIQVEHQKFNPESRLSLLGKWGHVHEKNMSTNKHGHNPSNISAVVYLSVPQGSGNIVFWPNPLHDWRYTLSPKKGMFLLFPSWIPHSVTRNLSSEPRVSASFNFKLEEK